MNTTLPLVPGRWQPLNAAESRAFLQRFDTHLHAAYGGGHGARRHPMRDLRAVPLTFYPGWLLVEGEADLGGGMVGTFDALYGPGFLWAIDGESRTIHQLNGGALPLRTDGAAAEGDQPAFFPSPLTRLVAETSGADYLHFFCGAVRGDQGAFRLVETQEDMLLCGVTSPSHLWQEYLRPVTVREDGDEFIAQAAVLYGGDLFDATFRITRSGGVTMEEDTSVATGIAEPEKTRDIFRHVRPAAAMRKGGD